MKEENKNGLSIEMDLTEARTLLNTLIKERYYKHNLSLEDKIFLLKFDEKYQKLSKKSKEMIEHLKQQDAKTK